MTSRACRLPANQLLDWELSTLGHPYADLAYQCAQWRLPAGRLCGLKGVDRHSLGILSERDYVATFCDRVGASAIPNGTFLITLSLFRLTSICQGVFKRALNGNAASEFAGEYGQRAQIIAQCAVEFLS
jgi:aminoglycoside phosphotransferase (APT) family kinase protein